MLVSQIRVDPISDTESSMSDPGSMLASPLSYDDLYGPPTYPSCPSPLPVPIPQHSRYFFNDVVADFMVSND